MVLLEHASLDPPHERRSFLEHEPARDVPIIRWLRGAICQIDTVEVDANIQHERVDLRSDLRLAALVHQHRQPEAAQSDLSGEPPVLVLGV
jgi:hypothetical protein